MRVIAGTARRLQLITPKGMATRPTTDRIKETLFNILQNEIYGSRFLDLYAGSGGIGIEALSRGAKEAVFVDNAREALDCIRANLQKTGLSAHAQVLAMDCRAAVDWMDGRGLAFDIIFLDPPYHANAEREVLERLAASSLVTPDTLLIVEAMAEKQPQDILPPEFAVLRVKTYGSNQHFFIRRQPPDGCSPD